MEAAEMNLPLTFGQILSASLYTQLKHRNNPLESPFMEQLEAPSEPETHETCLVKVTSNYPAW